MLQGVATQTDLNTLLLAGGGVSVALNAWFLRRLVARQDDLAKRMHKVESKLTAVLVTMGLLSPSDTENDDG
jgi:hypothetical protein